jgi:hypothetical protein
MDDALRPIEVATFGEELALTWGTSRGVRWLVAVAAAPPARRAPALVYRRFAISWAEPTHPKTSRKMAIRDMAKTAARRQNVPKLAHGGTPCLGTDMGRKLAPKATSHHFAEPAARVLGKPLEVLVLSPALPI